MKPVARIRSRAFVVCVLAGACVDSPVSLPSSAIVSGGAARRASLTTTGTTTTDNGPAVLSDYYMIWQFQRQFALSNEGATCEPGSEFFDNGVRARNRVVSGSGPACTQYTFGEFRVVPRSGTASVEAVSVQATVGHTGTGTGCSTINSVSPWVYLIEKCGVVSSGTYTLQLFTNTTYRMETNAQPNGTGNAYESVITLNLTGPPPANTDVTAPTSVASSSPAPQPTANGWSNSDVTVTLTASDDANGSGVQAILYSLSGAQTRIATLAPSGGSFVISEEGTTTVTFHATDNAGNAEADQTLDVRMDKSAPSLSVPADLTQDATSPDGAAVSFEVSATDGLSGVASVASDPASGSTFPIGATTVTVTATDRSGNTSTATFKVSVLGASDLLGRLIAAAIDAGFQQGANLLRNTASHIAAGRSVPACNQLNAFENQVKAQSGKQLSAVAANAFIAAAMQIRDVLACN